MRETYQNVLFEGSTLGRDQPRSMVTMILVVTVVLAFIVGFLVGRPGTQWDPTELELLAKIDEYKWTLTFRDEDSLPETIQLRECQTKQKDLNSRLASLQEFIAEREQRPTSPMPGH